MSIEYKNLCVVCGDHVMQARWALGYKTCLTCGDTQAKKDRMGWCVIQQYGKGGYQYVTPESAVQILKQTNQKQTRGD